jgi:DNA-binding XRE family transcriptional regulator
VSAARAAKLTAERRSDIAKSGAAKRWSRATQRDPNLGIVEGERMPCPHCDGTGSLDPQRVGIGDRFVVMRRKLGLKQCDLAPMLGVSRAQLANVESKPGSRPGLDMLVKAADTFDVSIDWLLGRKSEP